MGEQLAFNLPARPACGRADFFVSPANANALAQIEAWRDWPAGKLLLIGPEASGKSHLAQVWADMTGATLTEAAGLVQTDPVAALATGAAIVEDVDRLAGDRAAETALFHLHNLAAAEGAALLLTARTAPAHWPLALPDLASRIQATATAHLAPPDDALLAAVLVKLFADRQLSVPPEVIALLLTRMERSFRAAAETVAAIDRAALSTKRRPGVRLAREVLDKQAPAAR